MVHESPLSLVNKYVTQSIFVVGNS